MPLNAFSLAYVYITVAKLNNKLGAHIWERLIISLSADSVIP